MQHHVRTMITGQLPDTTSVYVGSAQQSQLSSHVASPVWAMIELQRLSGMRPGEVVLMRLCDIDRSGKVWLYRPGRHKAEHHGHARVVPLGPQAQSVLEPFLARDERTFLFSPKEAEQARNAKRRLSAKGRRARKARTSARRRP